MKRLFILAVFVILSCTRTYIKIVVGPEGKTVKLENIKFNFPKGAVSESTTIQLKIISERAEHFPEGYRTLKTTFSIRPETLIFEKPIFISMPVMHEREKLAVKFESGYLPIAGSKFENETLKVSAYHAGNYTLIEVPEKYGILNASKIDEALLLISDIYTGHYLESFRKYLKKEGYSLPVWTFIYSNEQSIKDNAKFLSEELKNLHKKFGEFRLDVVGFGIGGLITHCYIADTTLYQNDISSAIIAVGTPFFGSNFTNITNIKKGRSPYRFFYIDGMGEHAKDLESESDLISWIRKNRSVGRHSYTKVDENKNFASVRGQKVFDGELPEESDGDGLVSLSSTMLTFLEPEPFPLHHFQLFENQETYETIKGFAELYHVFNWPELFLKVWKGEEDFTKISEIWEKEINLHFRNPLNLKLLLDFNENLLLSVPENGILLTNGDNDTYPGWYLQTKGIRKDVLIVNWSLLNVADNAIYLKEKGLPISLTEKEIKDLRPIKKKTGEIVFIADSLVKIILENKDRPVVFASTVSSSRIKSYKLKLRGLVFEIGKGEVDIEKTRELFHSTFKLKSLYSTSVDSINLVCGKMIINYYAALFKLINKLVNNERYDEALSEIQYIKDFPISPMLLSPLYSTEASIYYKQDKADKGDEVLQELLDIERNLNIIRAVAETYYENKRKEKAIAVLADWLKDHPDDKAILKQLMDYGEE